MDIKKEHGEKAVEIARRVVDELVGGRGIPKFKDLPEVFKEKRGVFVTLEKHPSHELRGCIGYPEPISPLLDAIIDSAISAATRDPRFHPVKENELDKLVVEVTILTPPKRVEVANPLDYPKKIRVGRDGLIIKRGFFSGLLLPQVPVEWGWDEEEFLCQTCRKAGLGMDSWLDKKTEVHCFQGEVFSEETPRGKVIKKELGG
ncbi:MAG: TIGR00296 family protein [Candidatus Altiarchaeota archaeon]|nr:TIGR00296 family protein [Candidatus Altiarchaeota archaeon]